MIIFHESKNLIKMEIKLNLPTIDVFNFLQKKGYEVKSWLWKFEDETFPNGVTLHESWTFTATKDGEIQSEENLYLKVFEKEFKSLLKGVNL